MLNVCVDGSFHIFCITILLIKNSIFKSHIILISFYASFRSNYYFWWIVCLVLFVVDNEGIPFSQNYIVPHSRSCACPSWWRWAGRWGAGLPFCGAASDSGAPADRGSVAQTLLSRFLSSKAGNCRLTISTSQCSFILPGWTATIEPLARSNYL